MANFSETLTYWYLRLNGFFPIVNWVIHDSGMAQRSPADCDLLAVRFPNVSEVVGGQLDDWDIEKFDEWGIDIRTQKVGFIVEVKTDQQIHRLERNVTRSFNVDRLEPSLQRLGF